MTYDEDEARAKIAAWIELPALVAGCGAKGIDAALAEVELFVPTELEFGPLLHEATMAVDTVKSALVTLRDQAREREGT